MEGCTKHGPDWTCPNGCEQFVAEMERRVHDVKVNGNYSEVRTDSDGSMWIQEFRGHAPFGEPRPFLRPRTR